MKGITISIKKPFPFTSTLKRLHWCPNGCGKRVYYSCVNLVYSPMNFYFYCPVCDRYFLKDELE